jgi:ligand-binding sensor protein
MMSSVIEIIPATDFKQAEPIAQFFKVSGLQTLQDDFCRKTGVASLIMYPNGIPITKPSRFSRLCQLIRKTSKGGINCTNSDRIIGNSTLNGATIQPCKSGGLWDSGVRIHIGQAHVASWLIGQVMNEEQANKINQMMDYARDIGADIDDFSAAIAQVTVMDEEKFMALSHTLFVFAKQLGRIAEQQTADNFTECKTELSNIIATQSSISVLYQVWDRMIDDYHQGKLNV